MKLVSETPKELFYGALTRSFADRKIILPEEEALLMVDYISGMLADFTSKDRVFRPNEMRTKLDTITDMWMRSCEAGGTGNIRLARKEIGDFALFASGMFPEMVGNVSDYVRRGSSSYAALCNMTRSAGPYLIYYNLSTGFDRYRDAVNHARNRHMHMALPPGDSLRVFSDISLGKSVH